MYIHHVVRCTLYVMKGEVSSKWSFFHLFVRSSCLPDKLLKLPEIKRASNAFPGRNRLRAFASRAMKL